MARTLVEIQNQMLVEKTGQSALDGLTSDSTTAVWRLWVYILAKAIFEFEKLQDLFKLIIEETIADLRPGTSRWYVYMAKKYQHGFDLVPEQDYYDNTGVSAAAVTASKIIAYAAFVEEPFVRMKLAKLDGNNLAPLSNNERLGALAYIRRFRYAGVHLNETTVTSTIADKLRAEWRIKYNPLVLNELGERLDGTDINPVRTAIRSYLQNLDFNGLFSIQKMVDAVQAVPGVVDLSPDSTQTKYGALNFTAVNISFIPDSGYLVIEDADLLLTFSAA